MNQFALVYLAMMCLFASALDADAKRARFFVVPGFRGGETIDRVYDLPDQTAFMLEGKFFDLGYLNSSRGEVYVLYSGDQYVALDEAGLAVITKMLGFDPTVEDRAKHAAASEATKPLGQWLGGLVLLVGLFALLRRGIRWWFKSTGENTAGEQEDIDHPAESPEHRLRTLHQQRVDAVQNYEAVRSKVASQTKIPEPAPNRARMAARPFGRRSV